MLDFKNSWARVLIACAVMSVVTAAVAPNLVTRTAYAQVTESSIHGTVTDSSDAVVPDAKVTALNTATGIAVVTTTNRSGNYVFPSLQPGGPYTVTVEASGFDKFEAQGITLSVNANWGTDVKLHVGSNQQTVSVDASGVQVESTNTQLEQDINSDQIENLPLLGRDASGLEKLAPGAVESSDRFGGYSANGSQTTSNSYLLNGTDINDGPLQSEGLSINPDALQEENIVTSTINPEFARNGGSVINQVFKSGTNQLHGSGFEYYRDTFLNNGNYFSQTRPNFHQNLYGGTLGGPVLKDKLFGFVAYQGSRNRVGATTQTPVLPGGYTSGSFGSQALSSNAIPFVITTASGPCGPGTAMATWSDCFPSGAVNIPTSNFNSIASALTTKFVPAGNAGTAAAPLFNFNSPSTAAADQGVIRVDYHLSEHDALFGSFLFQSSPSGNGLSFGGSSLPGFGEIQVEHFKIASASYTHTFSPTMINELRAGYYRFIFGAVEPAQIVAPSSAGFAITPQFPAEGLPFINLTGLFSLGFSHEGPQPRNDTNVSGSDNLSKTIGNHNLKFGGTIEQFLVSNPYNANNNGDYNFGGAGTYSSGVPAIDFLLGIPDSYAQSSGGFVDAKAWEFYLFAQDSWKATPDLTVNYGIAWDTETPNYNEQFGGIGITCFSLSNATSNVFAGGFPGLTYPGDPGCNTQGGTKTKYDHFGPRLGFAWSPSNGPEKLIGAPGAHLFALRGGVGVYFNRDQEEGQLQNLGDTPFFKNSNGAADFGGSPGFANPFVDVAGNGSEANPFPFARPTKGAALNWASFLEEDMNAIATNYTTPYILNFNLNIQRELPGKMILQVGYVGSLGRKLATTFEGDPITAAGHAACLANPTCVKDRSQQHLFFTQDAAQPATTNVGGNAIPDYLSVGTLGTSGSSNYHSLQISLNKNLSHHLYFTLAYTYGHALDNASGLESSGFNGPGTNSIPGFQHLSYGNSDYDARQRVVASYDYEVPILASMKQNFIVQEALGGWHLAGITAFQSGFPIDITDFGTYNSLYCDQFSYYACPDIPVTSTFNIPKLNIRNPAHTFFDNGLFSQEPIGTFGNVTRNFLHGPGYNYSNMNLYKQLPLGRDSKRSIQLMLQASNVFNHANFANPDGNFTDGPLFGQVTSVKATADVNGDPAGGRTIQLAGKFRF
jgi:hypothetical protein